MLVAVPCGASQSPAMASAAQQGHAQIHAGPPLRARQIGHSIVAPEGVYKCVSSLPPPAGTFTGVVGASLGGSTLVTDNKPAAPAAPQRTHDPHTHASHQGGMLGLASPPGLSAASATQAGTASALNQITGGNAPLSVLVQAQQPRQPPPPRVALLTLRYHQSGVAFVEPPSDALHAAALSRILRDATYISQGTIPNPPSQAEQPANPIPMIAQIRQRTATGLSSLLQPRLAEVGPSLPLADPDERSGPDAYGKRPSTMPPQASETFVTRYQPNADLQRILAKPEGTGDTETFAFVSLDKTLVWLLDVGGRKSKEPLTRVSFAQPITAVTVNGASARPGARPVSHSDLVSPDPASPGSPESDTKPTGRSSLSSRGRIDVALGFTTGDVVWLDPVNARWSHMNAGGCLHKAPVTSLKWVPGTYLIFAAFADGFALLLEAGRADWRPQVPSLQQARSNTNDPYCHAWIPKQSRPILVRRIKKNDLARNTPLVAGGTRLPGMSGTDDAQEILDDAGGGPGPAFEPSHPSGAKQNEYALADIWDEEKELLVTHPGDPVQTEYGPNLLDGMAQAVPVSLLGNASAEIPSAGSQMPFKLLNPVSAWRVSKHRITDFAFAPPESSEGADLSSATDASPLNNLPLIAITDMAGSLRVIDLEKEAPLHTCKSYFGGLTSVAWSPDGRFLATGGEDDLLTLWAPREGRVIARAQGHTSFVTSIAFDPWRWPAEKRTYRLGSVGEDGRIFLWDFSQATLHRPKGHGHAPAPGSAEACADAPGGEGSSVLDLTSARFSPSGQAVVHHAPARGETASILPIVSHQLVGTGIGILTRIYFSALAITLFHRDGGIDVFARPGKEDLFQEEIDTDHLLKAIKAAQAARSPQHEKDTPRNWTTFKRRDTLRS